METETITSTETDTTLTTTETKRTYTKKEDMARGQAAILATLPATEEGALSKAEILAKLEGEVRELVERNWNLRIQYLEESGEILTKGRKVAKKYFKPAA